MERQTLHDAATNAANQGQSSHSYSAWRTSQQTQPRIFQYTPPNPQQNAQQQQQPQQPPQQALSAPTGGAGGAANANMATNLDKNILFANNDRLAQQYNLQNVGTPQQSPFPALHQDPATSQSNDPNLAQTADNPDPKDNAAAAPSTAPGGRVLAQSKRAAQNRAAQRAFRQRKDRYIKSLEQKANEYELSHSIITDLRKENIYLRDYVVRLQNEVDSLNTELGRAPMFASAPTTTQRTGQQQTQNPQANTMPVTLGQSYPIQLDPQTAAVAAAAAAASAAVNVQDNPLARLAPTADGTHNAISMPLGSEQQMVEQSKPEETSVQPKKSNRGRKRKNEVQAEGQ